MWLWKRFLVSKFYILLTILKLLLHLLCIGCIFCSTLTSSHNNEWEFNIIIFIIWPQTGTQLYRQQQLKVCSAMWSTSLQMLRNALVSYKLADNLNKTRFELCELNSILKQESVDCINKVNKTVRREKSTIIISVLTSFEKVKCKN